MIEADYPSAHKYYLLTDLYFYIFSLKTFLFLQASFKIDGSAAVGRAEYLLL